jgi:carboxyl-terminal processing protease
MKIKSFSIVNLVLFLLVSCGIDSLPASSEQLSSSESTTSVTDSSLGETNSSSTTSITSSESSSSVSQSTSSSSVPLTSLDRITLDLASVSYTLGSLLPRRGPNRSVMSWTSSHPGIITTLGAYVEMPIYADPVTVTLIGTATHGGLSASRTIEVDVDPIVYPTLSRSIKLPFVNTSDEYIVADKPEINVFFTDTGTVPYMDVETFINMIDGAIDSSIINFNTDGDLMVIDYRLEDTDSNNQPIFWDYDATIDFANNTIAVDDLSFFGNYVKRTETNFSEGLQFLGGIGVASNEVVIDLDDYRIDLIRYAGLYLAPISVLNLIFLNSLYYDVYYNGDTIYGFDTFSALDASSPVIERIKTSSFNSQTMSQDTKQLTYHFLALAFDYFYGLKNYKGIRSFYTYFNENGYTDQILIGDDQSLYKGLFNVAYGLDDLHTWHEATGFYEPTSYTLALTSLNQLGEGTQAFYQGRWAKEDQIDAAFGAGNMPPDVRLLDNETIAVIFIRGFNVDTPNFVKEILEDLPASVDDVILDLSFNTGGNLGAVLRLFGYITEEPIQYSSMNPTDGSAATYFYESSYDAFDYNWYIMTSSVTFSAANLMTSMAKEMGVATIIGTQSSGGAASIGLFVTPDGTLLLRSTLNVLATVTVDENNNRTYRNIEAGIPVDYVLNNTFNNTDIVALINQIRTTRSS